MGCEIGWCSADFLWCAWSKL